VTKIGKHPNKPAWKRALETSIAEADAGKTKFFASGEEFIAALEREEKKADRRKAKRKASMRQ